MTRVSDSGFRGGVAGVSARAFRVARRWRRTACEAIAIHVDRRGLV